ncbi:unnamed protein product [Schistosoma bovis]|nr:unnamed protein product [Schistosoma bovis]
MFHSLLFNIIVLHLIILVSIQVAILPRIYSIDEKVFTKYIKCFDLSALLIYKTDFGQGLDKLVGSVMNRREANVAKSSSRYKCLQKELKKSKKKAAKRSGMECKIPEGLQYNDMKTLIELSRNKYKIINSYNENLCK